MNTEQLISHIQNSTKKTPVKLYLKGRLSKINFGEASQTFLYDNWGIVFGEWDELKAILEKHKDDITEMVVENDRRNSAIPLLDLKNIHARIEPGAIIREHVKIGQNAVIMMGALINIGTEIGERTMIDMNATIGGRAIVGNDCHIGGGAILAGVIEPSSATPVVIEDNVMIGANAVVLEGVRVGRNSVVAAGAIVIDDVPPGVVVAGVPGKIIKEIDAKTQAKTDIRQELRQL